MCKSWKGTQGTDSEKAAAMIDIHRERLLTIRDACKRFPGRKDGSPINYETLRQWMVNGRRGVKLRRTRVGGIVYTSEEALDEFINAINGSDGVAIETPDQIAVRTSLARERIRRKHGI